MNGAKLQDSSRAPVPRQGRTTMPQLTRVIVGCWWNACSRLFHLSALPEALWTYEQRTDLKNKS